MSLDRFDHVAIEIADIDRHIAELEATGAMRLIRRGTLGRTGQRIAMLGDGTGAKIELIENTDASTPRLAHLAFRCDDAEGARGTLIEQGWEPLRGPHDLAEAKARTALLKDRDGLELQVIAYGPDSPDIVEWTK